MRELDRAERAAEARGEEFDADAFFRKQLHENKMREIIESDDFGVDEDPEAKDEDDSSDTRSETFDDPDDWDGVIHLSSFNCGCDSIASTLYHDILREKELPVMTLVLDEHAGQAGVDTRLEAFVDSIKDQHEHAASSL